MQLQIPPYEFPTSLCCGVLSTSAFFPVVLMGNRLGADTFIISCMTLCVCPHSDILSALVPLMAGTQNVS